MVFKIIKITLSFYHTLICFCLSLWVKSENLKGQCHEIFYPQTKHQTKPLGPWFTGWSRFDWKIAKIRFSRWVRLFCQSSPLLFTFSCNYMWSLWCLLMYSFCYGFTLKQCVKFSGKKNMITCYHDNVIMITW
jgi:hypothetical protein